MNPLWIVNFAKKDPIESFFAIYWNAILQNTGSTIPPKKWFYITDGTSVDDHQVLVNDVARRLTEDTQSNNKFLDKHIPAARRNEERLNVIFIGDLTEASTLCHFHTLAAELRANLLEDNPWSSIPIINFYGLLWRPNTVNFAPGVTPEAQAFLNELNTLMALDVNHVPFSKIFMFESSIKPEEKEESLNTMAMTALHIALGNQPLIDSQFINTGMAGMFYEKEVQKEKEAYLLSNILIDKFANSKAPEFFDANAATEYVESHGAFINSVQAQEIGELVTENCPQPNPQVYAWDLENTVSPFSLNLKRVWNQYYCDYIVNFKRNLINRTKKGISQFAQDYKDKLFSNQHKYITGKAKELEDMVFNLFSVSTSSKVVSIQQGIEVLNKFHSKIKEAAAGLNAATHQAFILPDNLKKAYEQVKNEHQNPNDTMAVLEGKLKNHPVFVLSMLVRAIILGFLVAYFGVFLIKWAVSQQLLALDWFSERPIVTGSILFLIPLVYAFIRFNEHVVRIKALKEQYISCMLMKMKAELEEDIRKCIDKTYHELDEYCAWLKKNKLEYLQKSLSVIPPADFSFIESVHFQPILKCSISNDSNNNKLLIPITSTRNEENLMEIKTTGNFNGADILDTPPLNSVQIQGNNYQLKEIDADTDLQLKTKLIKELLNSQATIYSSVEKEIKFGRQAMPNTKLLILDISGSMAGSALAELKKVVSELSVNNSIKWIAFNDKVVCTSEDDTDLMFLQAEGGTCYIPALEKAKEFTNDYYIDQIILISDGAPFEKTDLILKKAYELNQPINVVSIGSCGVSVMKELADKTAGMQIIVEDVSQIDTQLGNDLNVLLSVGDNGTFMFSDLLRKCHIPGCAKALYNFAICRTVCADHSIATLLVKYGNKKGLEEWGIMSEITCQYSQASNRQIAKPWCKMIIESQEDTVLMKLNDSVRNIEVEKLKGMPDMFVFLLCMAPIELRDLQWAGMVATNNVIRQKEKLMQLGVNGKAVNIFGQEFRM